MDISSESCLFEQIQGLLNNLNFLDQIHLLKEINYIKNRDASELFKIINKLKQELNFIRLENFSYEYFIKVNGIQVKDDEMDSDEDEEIFQKSVHFRINENEQKGQQEEKERQEEGQLKQQQQQEQQEKQQQQQEEKGQKQQQLQSQAQQQEHKQLKNRKNTELFDDRFSTFSTFRALSESALPESYRHLNYEMKYNIAYELTREIEDDLNISEINTYKLMKRLSSIIKEMKLEISELNLTIERLERTVLKEEKIFPYRLSREKFIYFCKNWIQNGFSLSTTIQLKLQFLQQKILTESKILIEEKQEYSNLMPIDYELLEIKRDNYKKELENANERIFYTRKRAAQMNLSITTQKNKCLHLENILKNIEKSIIFMQKYIENLNQEIKDLEHQITISNDSLFQFKQKFQLYKVPSIKQYMSIKRDLQNLYDEEKILKRKVYLLEIELKNTKKNLFKK